MERDKLYWCTCTCMCMYMCVCVCMYEGGMCHLLRRVQRHSEWTDHLVSLPVWLQLPPRLLQQVSLSLSLSLSVYMCVFRCVSVSGRITSIHCPCVISYNIIYTYYIYKSTNHICLNLWIDGRTPLPRERNPPVHYVVQFGILAPKVKGQNQPKSAVLVEAGRIIRI